MREGFQAGALEGAAVKRAFGYLRCSTDRQEVEAQRSQVRAFADFKKYELLDIGDEVDVSGSIEFAKRPVGAEILRRLDECDAVIFPKVDRGFRNTVDAILTVDGLRARGKDIHLLDIGMDTTTAMGRAFFQMSAVWAELERGRTQERIKERLAEAAQRPDWHHGPAPFGSRNLARVVDGRKVDGGRHGVFEQEAVAIETIRMYRFGLRMSLRDIAAALNKDGVPTRNGGRWAPQTVANIVGRMSA